MDVFFWSNICSLLDVLAQGNSNLLANLCKINVIFTSMNIKSIISDVISNKLYLHIFKSFSMVDFWLSTLRYFLVLCNLVDI
jgi:hypothetical protein